MSVDLNDPEIRRIRGELLDPSSGTSWFLCHYNPSSTTPALSVVTSGQKPVLDQWKEELVRLKGKGDAVAFGYGEFEGKGCILLCLDDSVAGVKRARAVVHSRAFAQLFPDYSALITISSHDQLNDALINERLGLDYYQQRHIPAASGSHIGAQDNPPTRSAVKKDDLPPLPPSLVLAEPITNTANSRPSTTQPFTISSPLTPAQTQFHPHHNATGPNRHVSSSGPVNHGQDTTSSRHIRQPSGTGPEPSSEPTADRERKTSLTARLGKAFGNPAMQTRPSDSPSEGSPTSASGSSRIKSSFSKAFRRTSDGTSPQQSPRADMYTAPPVPPKDDFSARPVASQGTSQAESYRTPSGGVGYMPPTDDAAPKGNGIGSSSSTGTFPEAVSRLYTAQSDDNHLSPSPSAKRIMTEARKKSVLKEEEIQNRFRRDLQLDVRQSGGKEEVVDEDEEVRLPYDTSDHNITDHLNGPGVVPDTENTAGPRMQIPRKPIDYGVIDPNQGPPHSDTLSPAEISSGEIASVSQVLPVADVSRVAREHEDKPAQAEMDSNPTFHLPDEERQREEVESQIRQENQAEVLRQKQADDLARQVEALRLQELHEQERQAAEGRRRAEAAAELQRHAEDYALQKEAERRREQEEQDRRDAEARQPQKELERQKEEEEEEKLRVVLEEHHRMEQVMLAEEEARRKEEEERRIEAQKQEAERARKEGIQKSLIDGKQNGSAILRGVGHLRKTEMDALPIDGLVTNLLETAYVQPRVAASDSQCSPRAHMLTPPYHFSVVACPAITQVQDDPKTPAQILYRGSIPATRNLPFLKRLGLKTVIYCKKKELKQDDVFCRWSRKRKIDLRWIKAEGMGEEKLGVGKNEISDVLKVILNPECYPLYVADLDGISHTTLIVACLRKLQGWHLDSIINEITRFQPEYKDLPLLAFINAYLIPSSETPFVLPSPPYPSWLWPTGPPSISPSPPTTRQQTNNRERTVSSGTTPSTVLPFPHPLTARKHPTMKLQFPAAPLAPPASGAPSSAQSPQLAAQNPNVTLSRVNSIRGSGIKSPEPDLPGLVGAASNLISHGLSRVASAVGNMDSQTKRLSRNVSFENDDVYLKWKASTMGAATPDILTRQTTNVSSEEISEDAEDPPIEMDPGKEEMDEDGEDEDEDDDEDEDEEDEEDEDIQPPSQYISALDLAGF